MRPHRLALLIFALCWLPGVAAGQFTLRVPLPCKPGQACPNPDLAARPRPSRMALAPGVAPPWQTVVRIRASADGSSQSIGTGVVIKGSAEGAVVLTAAHVVTPARGNPLTVETFGHQLDARTGSLGARVGTFSGQVIDADTGLDVALVRFTPKADLEASPLAAEGWSAGTSPPCLSLGCSRGNDPTIRGEQYAGGGIEMAGGTYLGIKCTPIPPHGRSGGGLFTPEGYLVAVCNFADEGDGSGIYADVSSLRSILRRNGLEALAAGGPFARRPPTVAPVQPPADPPAAPSPTPQPPAIAAAESAAATFLGPIVLGSGVGGAGLLATLLAFLRRKVAPAPQPTAPPAGSTDLGAAIALVASSLKAQAEARATAAENARLLAGLESLVFATSQPQPPKS